jgi:hypothetical protein
MQDAWRCSVFIFYLFAPGENKSETPHACNRGTSPIKRICSITMKAALGLK